MALSIGVQKNGNIVSHECVAIEAIAVNMLILEALRQAVACRSEGRVQE